MFYLFAAFVSGITSSSGLNINLSCLAGYIIGCRYPLSGHSPIGLMYGSSSFLTSMTVTRTQERWRYLVSDAWLNRWLSPSKVCQGFFCAGL